MDKFQEEWRPVVGYEGCYEVSNTGLVRSLPRKYVGNRYKILKPANGRKNYKIVGLSKNGKTKTRSVHRLVLTAFVPNPENKKTVNHIDGNPANNHLSNLEWATHSENLNHAFQVLGIRGGGSHLQPEQVISIRTRIKAGEKVKAIAKEYGMRLSLQMTTILSMNGALRDTLNGH